MAKNRDDRLTQLIQSAGTDKPALDFTEIVMKDIHAANQEEKVADPVLQSWLQQAVLEKPSVGFTAGVMQKVKISNEPVLYKPIISKRAWYAIAASIVLLASLSGFSQQEPGSTQVMIPYLVDAGNMLSNFFRSSGKLPSVYPLTFLSISALLIAEYFIRRRYHSVSDH